MAGLLGDRPAIVLVDSVLKTGYTLANSYRVVQESIPKSRPQYYALVLQANLHEVEPRLLEGCADLTLIALEEASNGTLCVPDPSLPPSQNEAILRANEMIRQQLSAGKCVTPFLFSPLCCAYEAVQAIHGNSSNQTRTVQEEVRVEDLARFLGSPESFVSNLPNLLRVFWGGRLEEDPGREALRSIQPLLAAKSFPPLLAYLRTVHQRIITIRSGEPGPMVDLYYLDLIGRAYDALYSIQPHRMPRLVLRQHENTLHKVAARLVEALLTEPQDPPVIAECCARIATTISNAFHLQFNQWFGQFLTARRPPEEIIREQYRAFENAEEFYLLNNGAVWAQVVDELTRRIEGIDRSPIALVCGGLSGIALAYPIAQRLHDRGVSVSVHFMNDMIAAQEGPRPPLPPEAPAVFVDYAIRSGTTARLAGELIVSTDYYVACVVNLPEYRAQDGAAEIPDSLIISLHRLPDPITHYNPYSVPNSDPPTRSTTEGDPIQLLVQISKKILKRALDS
jgi:hypothetical protein